MGTNFYLMSRNKKLMREHFAVETEYDIKDIEYAIVDEPYLGYEIHLNKLSWGWRPLFQRHKTRNAFMCMKDYGAKKGIGKIRIIHLIGQKVSFARRSICLCMRILIWKEQEYC